MEPRRHTFRTYVAGVSFRRNALRGLHEGQPLRLERDPDNAHDPNAIRVCKASGVQIGWVPAEDADTLASMIDGDDWIVEAHIPSFYGEGRAGESGVHLQITYYHPS